MDTRSDVVRMAVTVLVVLLVLLALDRARKVDYLLFHTLVELFSVIVAVSIFVIAWNTRRFLENAYLLFLGIAYLFVGGLDLVHMLTYRGMPVLAGTIGNESIQLWVAARYLESASLFLAAFCLGRRLKAGYVLLGYAAVFTLTLCAIFAWEVFPVCLAEAGALTTFKIASEYVICGILVAGLVLLLRHHRDFDLTVLLLLAGAIGTTIAAEISFTRYTDVYGPANFVGHLLKLVSFYLIYKAIIETGLTQPYRVLFRDLKESEAALRRGRDDLEKRVAERTAELSRANVQLQQDIARREQAETALRESQRTLATLMGNLPGMAYRCRNDRDWTMEFVSEGCLALTGYRSADLIGNRTLSYNDLIHPDDRAAVWNQVQEAVRKRRPFRMTYRIRTAAGQEKWVWEQGVGVFGADGKLEALEGLITDITERTRAEDELRRSEASLAEAQRIVHLGNWDWNIETNELSWSDEIYRIFGLAPQQFGATYDAFLERVHPDDRAAVQESVDRALRDREPYSIDHRIIRPDGEERVVHERGEVTFDESGRPVRMLGTVLDITERRRSEEDLARYRDHLEDLVRERTAELTETQVRLQESLHRLREEEEAGRMVQFKLLPQERRRIGHYEFSRYLVPSMYSSGDFVDYFEIDDHHLGFYMADVSGHGVSSAFVTVWLKSFMTNCLERHASESDTTLLEPAALLHKLNAELIREDLGKHVTIFYGVLRTDDNTLVFANGGQFPFPLICTDGRCEVVTARSWLVGIFDYAEYRNVERKLPSEFVFMLFSDGILEVLPQKGLARKLEALEALGCVPWCDVDSIVAALSLDEKQFPPDDIAFLIVRRYAGDG